MKGFTRYKTIEDFRESAVSGNLKVEDELVIEDIDGKVIFQVADIRKNKIIMVRKFCLVDERPMDGLSDWLNGEYMNSLPDELIMLIKKRKDNYIFLPREIEVFGEHHYSPENEKGRQWELFKKRKQRIRLFQNKYGSPVYWWASSPFVCISASFCNVRATGTPNYGSASDAYGVLPCFAINLKSLKSDAD